jgi:NAD(P)-dependent dehydrogenase (short-subunit alcohol dehydrogenase family)
MIDKLPLADKLALIVGGVGGIGAATAKLLAANGARVIVTHRGREDHSEVAEELLGQLAPGAHASYAADVTDTNSLSRLKEIIGSSDGKLDILVNAAGFTKPVLHSDLEALDDELIDRMFKVNWRGQFASIRTFAPLLKSSGEGLVVSISSIAGTTGVGSSIAYCAAKAGIDVMTKALARALAPYIRVLAVAPGVVDTGFVPGRGIDFNERTAATTPLKRIATPDDIAAAILSCATHLTFSTGTTIVVDGGRSL